MATPSPSGTYITLHEVRVWFDEARDTTQIASQDPDLPPVGIRMTARQGSGVDNALRAALRTHGVQSSKFTPVIPGQTKPVVLGGARNPGQLRAALLPVRRYGFADLNWSPGINEAEGLVTADWKTPVLAISGHRKSAATAMRSFLTQMIHKNGPTDVLFNIYSPSQKYEERYSSIDSITLNSNSSTDEVHQGLAEAAALIKERAHLMSSHPSAPRDIDDAREQAMNETLLGDGRLAEHPLHMPHIFYLLDSWDEMVEASLRRSPAQMAENLARVARAGAAVGVHFILSVEDPSTMPPSLLDLTSHLTFATESTDQAQRIEINRDDLIKAEENCGYYTTPSSSTVRISSHLLRM